MKKELAVLLLLVLLSSCAFAEGNPYIRLCDGVTFDMLNAEYWLSESDSEILLTAEEIATLPSSDLTALLSFIDEIDAEGLRAILDETYASKDPEKCFLNGEPTTAAYWEALREATNPNGIPDTLILRYGFTVQAASLRAMPTDDFLGETADDLFYDQMTASECVPFLPVIVLHESLDGEWYYIRFYGYSGWIRQEAVALCPSYEDWLARQSVDSFLIVTGRELRLNRDRACEALSGLRLPMGTKLPLLTAAETPETVSGRMTYYSYAVRLPVRGEDGMIEDVISLIPVSADVHVGYLTYTSENFLKLTFLYLGERYGQASQDDGIDCSGIVRSVYRCFGIELLRTSAKQSEAPFAEVTDLTGFTDDEKLAALESVRPGALLYFPGFIMVYLGMRDGMPYVISSVGTFATEDMDVGTVLGVNTVTVNTLLVHRRNGFSWLASLTKIVDIR